MPDLRPYIPPGLARLVIERHHEDTQRCLGRVIVTDPEIIRYALAVSIGVPEFERAAWVRR